MFTWRQTPSGRQWVAERRAAAVAAYGEPTEGQRQSWRDRKSGAACDKCGHRFEEDDERRLTRGAIRCTTCAPDHARWSPVAPCDGCGRPLSVDSYRVRRRVHTCSDYCYATALRLARPREREPIDCLTCGERIDARRSDTRYCSPACRQRAYRRRGMFG